MSVYIERYIFIESGSSGKSTPGDWVANAYSGQNDNKHKLRGLGYVRGNVRMCKNLPETYKGLKLRKLTFYSLILTILFIPITHIQFQLKTCYT